MTKLSLYSWVNSVTTPRWFIPVVTGMAPVGILCALVFLMRGHRCELREGEQYTQLRLPWRSACHRVAQGNQTWATHQGTFRCSWDFFMWSGTEVYPSQKGQVLTVIRTQPNYPGFFKGNFVEIQHKDGTRAIYSHLDGTSIKVKVGDTVEMDRPLGKSGLSGLTLYPHLHFQLTTTAGEPLASVFENVPAEDLQLFRKICAL